jgi:hypothetical protein
MVSSARASIAGGISSLRNFAVFKLMTKSNLAGCSTGSSAGFLQQFQSLRYELRGKERLASDITTQSGKAERKPLLHRIADSDKDDRNSPCCLFCRQGSTRASGCHNHIGLERDKLSSERREPIDVRTRPTIFDGDIPALHEAVFEQLLEKRLVVMGPSAKTS